MESGKSIAIVHGVASSVTRRTYEGRRPFFVHCVEFGFLGNFCSRERTAVLAGRHSLSCKKVETMLNVSQSLCFFDVDSKTVRLPECTSAGPIYRRSNSRFRVHQRRGGAGDLNSKRRWSIRIPHYLEQELERGSSRVR